MKNLFLFLLFLLPVFFCNAAERGVSEKSTGKNLVKMQKNALLIDVRTEKEFASGHLKGAVNIPDGNVTLLKKKGAKKDTPLFLYCRSGRRVKAAIKNLKKEGYTCLYDLGGMKEAEKKLALPVVK